MSEQLAIEFSVHTLEDNAESQKYLDSGKKSFSGKCRILFDAFMRGEVINTLNSPVSDFRRRRQDLTDNNAVKISLYSTDGRLKNWYMDKIDINYNRKFIS